MALFMGGNRALKAPGGCCNLDHNASFHSMFPAARPVAQRLSVPRFLGARLRQQPPKLRLRLVQLLALPVLGLASPSAHALGFTGSFDPSQWVVVNTYAGGPETLTGNNSLCQNSNPDYYNGCVSEIVGDQALGLYSTSNTGQLGNGYKPNPGDPTTTTLSLLNTSGSPLRISFNWGFDNLVGEFTDGVNTSVTLSLSGGSGGFANFYPGQAGLSYTSPTNQPVLNTPSAYAYVPAGATLSFSIVTNNVNAVPFAFALDNFQAVPSPLPISGAGSAFLVARRLRRRVQQADRLKAASPSSSARLPNFSAQRAQLHHQQALSHYGRLLSGPIATAHCANQGAATALS